MTQDRIADWFRRIAAWLKPPQGRQVAALCWRRTAEGVEVLLVTTRRTGRWTPPKGGVKSKETFADGAAREAWEEAGVDGRPSAEPIGVYDYLKYRKSGAWERMRVDVHAVEAVAVVDDFPEAGQRDRSWRPPKEAAGMVNERRLGAIIGAFDPPPPKDRA